MVQSFYTYLSSIKNSHLTRPQTHAGEWKFKIFHPRESREYNNWKKIRSTVWCVLELFGQSDYGTHQWAFFFLIIFTTTQRQSRFESEVRLKTGGRPKRWAVRLNQQLLPWFFDKVGAAKGQSNRLFLAGKSFLVIIAQRVFSSETKHDTKLAESWSRISWRRSGGDQSLSGGRRPSILDANSQSGGSHRVLPIFQ